MKVLHFCLIILFVSHFKSVSGQVVKNPELVIIPDCLNDTVEVGKIYFIQVKTKMKSKVSINMAGAGAFLYDEKGKRSFKTTVPGDAYISCSSNGKAIALRKIYAKNKVTRSE